MTGINGTSPPNGGGGISSPSAHSRFYMAPPLVCLYGVPKSGKSTATLYDFPNALFLCGKGALKPAESVCGFTPAHVVETDGPPSLGKLNELVLKQGVALAKSKQIDAVVCDDFSSAVKKASVEIGSSVKDGRQVQGILIRRVMEFLELIRYQLGCAAILNCHIKHPRPANPKEGVPALLGGPDLPGGLVEEMPKFMDVIVRAEYDMIRRPWPYSFRCGPWSGTDYITGDRHNLAHDRVPMNLGELLRLSGFPMRYHQPWQKGVVENIANCLLGGASESALFTEAAQWMLKQGASRLDIVWSLRDARDRAEIVRNKPDPLSFGFGVRL